MSLCTGHTCYHLVSFKDKSKGDLETRANVSIEEHDGSDPMFSIHEDKTVVSNTGNTVKEQIKVFQLSLLEEQSRCSQGQYHIFTELHSRLLISPWIL